jgi:hypothetical protein
MKITRTSVLTGIQRTLDLPCTRDQLALWREGEELRFAAPDLTNEDLTFVQTGVVPPDWENVLSGRTPRDGVRR